MIILFNGWGNTKHGSLWDLRRALYQKIFAAIFQFLSSRHKTFSFLAVFEMTTCLGTAGAAGWYVLKCTAVYGRHDPAMEFCFAILLIKGFLYALRAMHAGCLRSQNALRNPNIYSPGSTLLCHLVPAQEPFCALVTISSVMLHLARSLAGPRWLPCVSPCHPRAPHHNVALRVLFPWLQLKVPFIWNMTAAGQTVILVNKTICRSCSTCFVSY